MEGHCEWSSDQRTLWVLSSWGINNNLHDIPFSPTAAALQPPRVAPLPGWKGMLRGKPGLHHCSPLCPWAETSCFPTR